MTRVQMREALLWTGAVAYVAVQVVLAVRDIRRAKRDAAAQIAAAHARVRARR